MICCFPDRSAAQPCLTPSTSLSSGSLIARVPCLGVKSQCVRRPFIRPPDIFLNLPAGSRRLDSTELDWLDSTCDFFPSPPPPLSFRLLRIRNSYSCSFHVSAFRPFWKYVIQNRPIPQKTPTGQRCGARGRDATARVRGDKHEGETTPPSHPLRYAGISVQAFLSLVLAISKAFPSTPPLCFSISHIDPTLFPTSA